MSVELKPKAAIYIRVSTQYQIDKDSLQVQRRELKAYSELMLGIRDYEIFEDPGYSAKNTDRPAYQQMMTRLRSGEFSHLLVWKIDRVSRNLLDFAQMYAELKRIGVTFVSKNEQFDTSTAIGEAMLKIILVFAELERQMTAERVSAVMLSRANNGQWNGGRVPFGYDWDKESGSFTVNTEEAKLYNYICDLYEERQSLLEVCKIINNRNLKTRIGNEWSPVAVRKLLTNVFYLGIYRYNVHSDGKGIAKRSQSDWVDVRDHHPALIDEARFNRIERILKRNRRKGEKKMDTYRAKKAHIFAGLIECGNCGANMTATRSRRNADGWDPTVYGCSRRRKVKDGCVNKYISDSYVVPFVFSLLSAILYASRAVANGKPMPDLSSALSKQHAFDDVKKIIGLDNLSQLIASGQMTLEYQQPKRILSDPESSEVTQLRSRRAKDELAIQRLQSLFLYGAQAISEKDYIIERKAITDDMELIDKRLGELNSDTKSIDTGFLDKASYFLMIQQLIDFKSDRAWETLKAVDSEVSQAFVRKIVDRIKVTNGIITEIRFKNGAALTFLY